MSISISHNEIHFNSPKREIIRKNTTVKNLNKEHHKVSSRSINYKSVRISLYEIFNGYLIPIENGGKIITDSSGKIIHNQINNIYDNSIDNSNYPNPVNKDFKVEIINGTLIDLTSSGSSLFSFWLLEALPKLKLIEMHGKEFNSKVSILVNQKSKFVTETLELFGFSNLNLIIRNGAKTSFKADLLLCPRPIREKRYTPSWALEYIREKYKLEKTINPLKKIYISRNHSNGRRVINEEEFTGYLLKSGFQILYAEDYSSVEFSKLIDGAWIVISPHGAGLANIIFANKGSNIIELYGAHYTDQYQLLALELEQNYIAVECISEDGIYYNDYNRNNYSVEYLNRKSFTVNLTEVTKLIESIQ